MPGDVPISFGHPPRSVIRVTIDIDTSAPAIFRYRLSAPLFRGRPRLSKRMQHRPPVVAAEGSPATGAWAVGAPIDEFHASET